jgi:RNA polymerase sigma-70 factor (ECF subfamily)
LTDADALSEAEVPQLDAALVAALYVEHADELKAFLLGVLRDRDLVGDALQGTFVKAIEFGHTAQAESLKSWLFQVAFREALVLRRRQATDERARQRIGEQAFPSVDAHSGQTPDVILVRRETLEAVRGALEKLPDEQRTVVRLRMYEQLKFSKIAEQLDVPLGTVLTRMQLALKKLLAALETAAIERD